MSTTPTDALDDWLSELTGGESSMRRLRAKLRTEAALDDDCCPTCQRPPSDDAPHTGHLTAEPADSPTDQPADAPTDRPRSPLLARVTAARSRARRQVAAMPEPDLTARSRDGLVDHRRPG